MVTLEIYINELRAMVREANKSTEHGIKTDDLNFYIRKGMIQLSRDRPLFKVSEVTGINSKYITINSSNFPGFIEGFSFFSRIEPDAAVIANNETPRILEADQYSFYRDTVGLRLFFKNHQPSTSDIIRSEYSVVHTINGLDSESVDTVPMHQHEPLLYWAAGEYLMSLANKYAGTQDPTLRADVVNYRGRSLDFSNRAKDYFRMYNDVFEDHTFASATRDVDQGFNDGVRWLTHPSFR